MWISLILIIIGSFGVGWWAGRKKSVRELNKMVKDLRASSDALQEAVNKQTKE